LGTGSAYPSPHRGASGLILRNTASGVQWLFDCGEGTQIQVQKFPEAKISRVTRIFISHLHGDHVFGLPGFLATMGNRNAKGETRNISNHDSVDVEIYGPQGLRRFLRLSLSLSWTLLNFKYAVHQLMFACNQKLTEEKVNWASSDLHPELEPILPYEVLGRDIYPDANGFWQNVFGPGTDCRPVDDEQSNLTVHAMPLKHSVPSVGWLLLEAPPPRRMLMKKVKELGVPVGPLLSKLKKGETITFENFGGSITVSPDQVMGEVVRGRRIAILGDSCDSSALRELLYIVSPEDPTLDTLVHEATMHSSLEASAYEKGHTTAAGAARFAASIGVRQLILSHFSQRYIPNTEAAESTKTRKVLETRFIGAMKSSFHLVGRDIADVRGHMSISRPLIKTVKPSSLLQSQPYHYQYKNLF
uniref:Lactamase_B domain-containing protein n=1 Tax=Schistocephalus solidus TaxID=70667 RepID=A0A183T3W7_SCHSO